MRRACFVLWASWVALTVLMAGPAHAEDKRAAALSWVRLAGAETCIDAASLARRVEARLGRSVFPAPAQAALIVEGHAERNEGGFSASLRIFDQAGSALGSRELSSNKPSCDELSETVVLVLAVMIDPDGALAAIPDAPKEPAPKAAEPEPVVAKPATAARADGAKRDLSVFGRLELGSMPEPAFGIGGAAVVSFAALRTFRVEAAAFSDERRSIGGDASRGARFRLLYATLEYCPLFVAAGRFGFTGCAGPSVGVLQSRSFGLDPRENDLVDLLVNGVAQLRADVRLVGAVHGIVGAGVGVPFIRTLYEVTDRTGTTRELFEPDALLAHFDLGLAARF